MIHFRCRYCYKELEASPAQAGHAVICSGCKARLTVPASSEDFSQELVPPPVNPDEVRRARARVGGGDRFIVRLMVGSLLLILPAALGVWLQSPWPGVATILAGSVLQLVALVWFLFVAFGDSVLKGLLCLVVPFYALFYLISNFAETKHSFFTYLAGIVIAGAGSGLLFLAMR